MRAVQMCHLSKQLALLAEMLSSLSCRGPILFCQVNLRALSFPLKTDCLDPKQLVGHRDRLVWEISLYKLACSAGPVQASASAIHYNLISASYHSSHKIIQILLPVRQINPTRPQASLFIIKDDTAELGAVYKVHLHHPQNSKVTQGRCQMLLTGDMGYSC